MHSLSSQCDVIMTSLRFFRHALPEVQCVFQQGVWLREGRCQDLQPLVCPQVSEPRDGGQQLASRVAAGEGNHTGHCMMTSLLRAASVMMSGFQHVCVCCVSGPSGDPDAAERKPPTEKSEDLHEATERRQHPTHLPELW